MVMPVIVIGFDHFDPSQNPNFAVKRCSTKALHFAALHGHTEMLRWGKLGETQKISWLTIIFSD